MYSGTKFSWNQDPFKKFQNSFIDIHQAQSKLTIVGASLSEPHTSVTPMHVRVYVYLSVCLGHIPKILNEGV